MKNETETSPRETTIYPIATLFLQGKTERDQKILFSRSLEQQFLFIPVTVRHISYFFTIEFIVTIFLFRKIQNFLDFNP